MKYVCILADGMSDLPLPERNNKTPMELAHKPYMDRAAAAGRQGLVLNVPPGMSPGSDTANMSAMGIDAAAYYTGRSPLEAVSLGIDMSDDEIALRVNLVTVSEEENLSDCTMIDYSAGEISSEEAAELIAYLNAQLPASEKRLYNGKSYRHCLIWPAGPQDTVLTPPHDISGRKLDGYLPQGKGSDYLLWLMTESRRLLRNHPLNAARVAAGKNPASMLWPWGLGTKPGFPPLSARYPLKSAAISAVDLIQGIAMIYGMDVIHVDGATGNLHTNFRGKAQAAIQALQDGHDYIFLHVEAADECGHQGDIDGKIQAIELIDAKVIAPIWEYLETQRLATAEDYRIYILPDHPTPLALRTHTSDPVPYAIFDSSQAGTQLPDTAPCFSEQSAAAAADASGEALLRGHQLFDIFIKS